MADSTPSRTLRIGFVVALSLLVLMIFIFFIGSEQKIFSRKNEYYVRFDNVSGLASGNPVQLSGVTIGVVSDIQLPQNPSQRTVLIVVQIDRKYAGRIRRDSRARLKKLGLIAADSYIDISPGSPSQPVLPPGSEIPAQRQTNVDALIASGEDLVDNFVEISHSLKNILQRVDRGEGLLGELTTEPQTKQRITDTLLVTLDRTNSVLSQVQSGRGLAGRLLYDEPYGERVAASLEDSLVSVRSILANVQQGFETGEGALPALLSDPSGRRNVNELLANLRLATENLALLSTEMRSGEGIVPRLFADREFADSTMNEFGGLVAQLGQMAKTLNEGEGTVGRLVSDPSIYEAINDILIGINESRLLRWLIRNRQQSGIQQRVQTEQRRGATVEPVPPEPIAPPPEVPRADDPPPPPPPEAPFDSGSGEPVSELGVTSTAPAEVSIGSGETEPAPETTTTSGG
jgi:phospholipid/cholesterol/gamma-HCH transport system substrate-binding protein